MAETQEKQMTALEEEQAKAAERKRKRDEQRAKEQRKQEARAQGRVFGKAQLMQGTGEVTEQYFDRIQAFIPMRRLNEGEAGELAELQSQGVEMLADPTNPEKRQVKIDTAVANQGARAAMRLAVAKSLSVNGEHWEVEDVAALEDIQLVSDIAERVYELSGMSEESQEDIKSVRNDGGGGDPSVDVDERDAAGGEVIGINARAESLPVDSGSEGGGENAGG